MRNQNNRQYKNTPKEFSRYIKSRTGQLQHPYVGVLQHKSDNQQGNNGLQQQKSIAPLNTEGSTDVMAMVNHLQKRGKIEESWARNLKRYERER